jgi:hypothetical protein
MAGKIRMGETRRAMRFDFTVRGPTMLVLLWHWLGTMTGAVTIDGFVADAPATGELETAPIRGWMRYDFTFTGPNGEQLRFDGRKRIRFIFFGWTVLRGAVTDATGQELGRAVLHFKYHRHFLPMLISMRPIRKPQPATHA